MDKQAFVAAFGHLFEHSPWVVERAYEHGPFRGVADLHIAFMRALWAASPEERLGVLRAHPRLADKAQIAAGLTKDSASEQSGAGLTALTAEEFATFHDLNEAYAAKFGFPFVICVKLMEKASILAAMRRRLEGEYDAEFEEAITQVGLISRMRLGQMDINEEALA